MCVVEVNTYCISSMPCERSKDVGPIRPHVGKRDVNCKDTNEGSEKRGIGNMLISEHGREGARPEIHNILDRAVITTGMTVLFFFFGKHFYFPYLASICLCGCLDTCI